MPEEEPKGIPESKKGPEKLAEWLVPDPKEWGKIQNSALKMEIQLLGRHGDKTTATPERLLKTHERIEEMVRSGQITLEEAAVWMGPIEQRHQELVEAGTKDAGEKEFGRVYEGLAEGRELGPIPPNEVVALFRQGRLGMYERFWGEKVKFLDITKEEERNIWALLNMEAFNHDIITNPHERWKGVIDFWLTDLRDATRLLGRDERHVSAGGIKETERLIKAMMAISASARAMDVSSGNAGTYCNLMTPGGERGPNLDRADEWEEFLLHGDPEKLSLVIGNPVVRFFYVRVLKDAGYDVPEKWELDENYQIKNNLLYNGNEKLEAEIKDRLKDKIKDEKALEKAVKEELIKLGYISALDTPSFDRAKEGDLVRYLREHGFEGKEGFDGYIEHLMKEDPGVKAFVEKQVEAGIDEVSIWSAAKLACDSFLVDKYTEWEYEVTEVEKRTENEKHSYTFRKLIPKVGWGGNPLTSVIQPTFLQRHIKKVWAGDDRAVLDLADGAFHPEETTVLRENGEKDKQAFDLKPTMVGEYKAYARYSDALWRFVGGSQGQEIPLFTPKTFESNEGLHKIALLLDQVLGTGKKKELKAIMLARMIQAKALAAAALSAKPGLREDLGIILDPENREMPFLEVRKELWGPDFRARSGFLARLASGELRFKFEGNPLAIAALKQSFAILVTNDQTLSRERMGQIATPETRRR